MLFPKPTKAPHFLNVHAVAAAIAEENPVQNVAALEEQAKACVQPAIDWFLRKFNVQLYNTVSAFKAARCKCPVSVQWLKPSQQSVEALQIFPFLDDDDWIINGLKDELPAYLAASEEVVINTEDRKVKWWHDHKDQLPHWASAAKKVLLMQPSSAAAEKVFSILNSDRQEHALVDYLQASVMTQYNKRLLTSSMGNDDPITSDD